jgi:hypothetical protein
MRADRKREIERALESYQQTDCRGSDSEKTAFIQELLAEVGRLENSKACGWQATAEVLAEVEQYRQDNQPVKKY